MNTTRNISSDVMRSGTLFPVLVFAGHCAMAADENVSDSWQFQATPCLWLPTIDGKLNYDLPPSGGAPILDVGPTDWLDLLNGVALIQGGAMKGRISIFANFLWLGLESDNDKAISVTDTDAISIPIDVHLNVNAKTNFDGTAWTLAAGYTLKETETSSCNLFGGVRHFAIDVSTSWNLTVDITLPSGEVVLPAQGNIGNKVELWDGIVGLRGRFAPGQSKLSVPHYLDVGTGSSHLTWQAMTGTDLYLRLG